MLYRVALGKMGEYKWFANDPDVGYILPPAQSFYNAPWPCDHGMKPKRWTMASQPPSDNLTPTASPPTLASPPPVASSDAADVPMDGTPSADERTATVFFNLGTEDIHDAILRVSVIGPKTDESGTHLLDLYWIMLGHVCHSMFFADPLLPSSDAATSFAQVDMCPSRHHLLCCQDFVRIQ